MKTTRYYPVFLNLDNFPCLVVGGGRVAARKVEALLEAGARVSVVSPELSAELHRRARSGEINWVASVYRTCHMRNARLVIGATDNPRVNERVFLDAESKGLPVNIVDDPRHCRFIVPASFQRGDIQVAVTTGGGAPGVAPLLRKKLEEVITNEYAILVQLLKAQRARIKSLAQEKKETFWKSVVDLPLSALRTRARIKAVVEKLLAHAESEAA